MKVQREFFFQQMHLGNLEEEAANEVYEERISLYERAANKNVLEALLYLGRVYKKQNNYN